MADDDKEYTETYQGQNTAFPIPSGLPTESEMGDSDYDLSDAEERDAEKDMSVANSADRYNHLSQTLSGLTTESETEYGDEEHLEIDPPWVQISIEDLLEKSEKEERRGLKTMIEGAERDIATLGYTSLEPKWETDSLRGEEMYSNFFEEVDVKDEKDLEKHLQEREAYWSKRIEKMEGVKFLLSQNYDETKSRLEVVAEKRKSSFFSYVVLYFKEQWLKQKKQGAKKEKKNVKEILKEMKRLELHYRNQWHLEKHNKKFSDVERKNAPHTKAMEETANRLQNLINTHKLDTPDAVNKLINYIGQSTLKLSNVHYDLIGSHEAYVNFWKGEIEEFTSKISTLKSNLQEMKNIVGEKPSIHCGIQIREQEAKLKGFESLLENMQRYLSYHEGRMAEIEAVKLKELLHYNAPDKHTDVYNKVISDTGELKVEGIDKIVGKMEKRLVKKKPLGKHDTARLEELRKIVTASLLLDIIKQGDEKSQRNEKVESKKALLERIVTVGEEARDLHHEHEEKPLQTEHVTSQKKEKQGMFSNFRNFLSSNKKKNSSVVASTTQSFRISEKSNEEPEGLADIFGGVKEENTEDKVNKKSRRHRR